VHVRLTRPNPRCQIPPMGMAPKGSSRDATQISVLSGRGARVTTECFCRKDEGSNHG
jgi:hypothetical protein